MNKFSRTQPKRLTLLLPLKVTWSVPFRVSTTQPWWWTKIGLIRWPKCTGTSLITCSLNSRTMNLITPVPLISFLRARRSSDRLWKYYIISSRYTLFLMGKRHNKAFRKQQQNSYFNRSQSRGLKGGRATSYQKPVVSEAEKARL